MHFSKLLSLGATAAVLAAAAPPASAQILTKIGNTQINGTSTNVVYDGTNFSLSNGLGNSAAFFGSVGQGNNMSVDIAFGPVTQTNFTIDAMNNFNIITSGGSFKITDHVTNAIVLQGTFGQGALGGTIGGNSGSFNLLTSSVVYGGSGGPGNMFPAGFLTANGSLQAGFVTANSFVGIGGGPTTGVAPFAGTDTLTFSARTPAVPEPGALTLFSGIGVCGTVFGLRRIRSRK